MNRDVIVELQRAARDLGQSITENDEEFDPEAPADDGNPFGSAAHELTTAVDVHGYLGHKRAALGSHRSQIGDTSFFLLMPDEVFALAFGTEWFIERGVEPRGPQPGWFFADTPADAT
jgi:LmbE family N-acetylglucosaminyl deacetylase